MTELKSDFAKHLKNKCCERNAEKLEEVLFKWWHYGIPTTEPKVRTTYKTNSTMLEDTAKKVHLTDDIKGSKD